MKKFILLFLLAGLFNLNLQASFPVNTQNVEEANAKIESLVDLEKPSNLKPVNITMSPEDALSPAVTKEGTKGLIISLVLWFFLGFLAGHRWYKSKPIGWNILFILSLGGFGIWWLIDGIAILTNNF